MLVARGARDSRLRPNDNHACAGQALIAATLRSDGEISVVKRGPLFLMNALPREVQPAYDVFPDGKRFVFSRIVVSDAAPIVVTGWLDEVRELITGATKK